MARPQMDSRVDGPTSPTSQQSCRMEVLCREVWPSGGTQPVSQPRHRHRSTANQTSPAPQPLAPMQEALSVPRVPQQDGLLRDNTSTARTEQERPCPAESSQPLPDLLLESHGSSSNSSHRDSPADEEPTPEEQAIHRVAIQLRTIGDEMNAVYLQRRNEAPQWQNWRGLYRGLVAFLADTISTLYQHGLR